MQAIAKFLDVKSLVKTFRVCKAWKKGLDTDDVWLDQIKKIKSWRRDITYPRREWNQLPNWPKTLFVQRYNAVCKSKITLSFSGARGRVTMNVPLSCKTSDLAQECASLLDIHQPFGIVTTNTREEIIPSNLSQNNIKLLDWIGFETACSATCLDCKITFEIPPSQDASVKDGDSDNRLEEIQRLLQKQLKSVLK